MAKGRTSQVTKQGVDIITEMVDKYAHMETSARYQKQPGWERQAVAQRLGMTLLASRLGVRCGCREMYSAEHGRSELHCTCATTIRARDAELKRLTREHERR